MPVEDIARTETERAGTGPAGRFVLVPADNAYNAHARTSSFEFLSAISGLGDHPEPNLGDAKLGAFRVLDAVDLNEATLVEMTAEQAVQLQHLYPSLHVAPERVFELFRARMFKADVQGGRAPAGDRRLTLAITGPEGEPVAGARVDIALDAARRWVLRDLVSDAEGRIAFSIEDRWTELDLVVVSPRARYWSATATAVAVPDDGADVAIRLQRIAAGHRDSLDLVVPGARGGTGAGVRVAVIDAGSSLPAAANVVPGINTVDGEDDADTADNGTGHGSHVAGIVRRVAPDATIVAYRVCGKGSIAAREIPIAKAIRHAVDNDCDIVSLSLGQANEPLAVTREIKRARALGTVVVAATGNDWGAAVAYPARTTNVIAVSACGHVAGAPAGVVPADVAAAPPPAAGDVYLARFSNVGPEVDFVAPGVAIVSNVSPTELGAMDGTSMAAPAMAGLVARLLSADATLLNSDRTQQRSDDVVRECHRMARAFGFGRPQEGSGLLAS